MQEPNHYWLSLKTPNDRLYFIIPFSKLFILQYNIMKSNAKVIHWEAFEAAKGVNI